jgi:hypothetical protein
LPYLTLGGGPSDLVSMSRFNLVSFPLFVTMAHLGLRAADFRQGAEYHDVARHLTGHACQIRSGAV